MYMHIHVIPDDPVALYLDPAVCRVTAAGVFTTNKRGYPVLSRAHQDLLATAFKFGVQVILTGDFFAPDILAHCPQVVRAGHPHRCFRMRRDLATLFHSTSKSNSASVLFPIMLTICG
jgi:hypothetical protein